MPMHSCSVYAADWNFNVNQTRGLTLTEAANGATNIQIMQLDSYGDDCSLGLEEHVPRDASDADFMDMIAHCFMKATPLPHTDLPEGVGLRSIAPEDRVRVKKVVDRLADMGFFSLLSEEQQSEVAAEICRHGYALCVETNRVFNVDAKDIARRGLIVPFRVLQHWREVNGIEMSLREKVNLKNEQYVELCGINLKWDRDELYTGDYAESAIRILAIFNRALEACGTSERMYCDFGLDKIAMLHPRMYEELDESGVLAIEGGVWTCP